MSEFRENKTRTQKSCKLSRTVTALLILTLLSFPRFTIWQVCVWETSVPNWTSPLSSGGRSIWTCFEFSLVHCTQLMMDRHLDQLLLCAVYVTSKVWVKCVKSIPTVGSQEESWCVCAVQVTNEDKSFQNIMKCYRTQPQANSNVGHTLFYHLCDLSLLVVNNFTIHSMTKKIKYNIHKIQLFHISHMVPFVHFTFCQTIMSKINSPGELYTGT